MQDLPDQLTGPVCDHAHCLGVAKTDNEPPVDDLENTVLRPHRRMGGLIEGAGHLSNIEQPEKFNGAVLGFLMDHRDLGITDAR